MYIQTFVYKIKCINIVPFNFYIAVIVDQQATLVAAALALHTQTTLE